MRALYEIDNEILECVDLETGEIIDEEKLEALEMEREKKIEAVILWRKDLLAEAEAVRSEARNLSDRASKCENKAEQLKKYIDHALGGEVFKTDRCSVSYRKTKSIVIDNLALLPVDVWKDMDEKWISKSKIKELLDAGKTVEGAHQEIKDSMIIR